MANGTLDKTTVGFSLSAAVLIVFNTLLVIVKETSPPILAAMARATGHHWISHGIIVIGLFVVLGFVFSATVKSESWGADKLGRTILWSVIVAGVVLAAFILLH